MSIGLVSVILPTHNRCSTLLRAVNSVLRQSWRELELIVVDDASDDGTDVLLGTVQDPRLRIIRRVKRGGAACARNEGIKAARGALIAFQDSDDEWLSYKLERQIAALNDCDLKTGWVGGAYLVNAMPTIHYIRSERLESGMAYEAELLTGEPFVTPVWLVRREYLFAAGLFDESMPCLEDWDLILKLSRICRFRAVGDVVLVRHASADSLYGDVRKRMRGLEVVLTRHRESWIQDPRCYGRWCAELGRLFGLFGERKASRRWLQKAFRENPWSVGVVALLIAAHINAGILQRMAQSRLAMTFR